MASSSSSPTPIEPTPDNLKKLSGVLAATYSPDEAQRSKAEATLQEQTKRPGFSILLLRFCCASAPPAAQRQSAAILLKNIIKQTWEGKSAPLPESEQTTLKQELPEAAVSTASLPKVQAQLGESISLIAAQEFPERWGSLLPALVSRLKTLDYSIVNGVLETLVSIFKRYGNMKKSHEETMRELIYVLDHFQEPLHGLFAATAGKIASNPSNEDHLKAYFQALLSLSRLYYYLLLIDLPEYFEDNCEKVFPIFNTFLSYTTEVRFLLENPEDSDRPSILHQVQGSILEILNIWIEKYEPEFKKYLSRFTQATWQLLSKCDTRARFDPVVTAALTFLTTAAKSVNYEMFKTGDILKNICQGVITPQIMFRKSDMELFQETPFEYIRFDSEGVDAETRRRASFDLIKGLRKYFEAQVSSFFVAHTKKLLADYAADAANNWRAKDAALNIMQGLLILEETLEGGVEKINPEIPFEPFFNSQIVPELRGKKGHPVVQADCLKFVFTFRNQLPDSLVLPVFTESAQFLNSPNVVVHSYAAIVVNQLLRTRKEQLPPAAIKKLVPHILAAIFKRLRTSESKENHYLIKALFRLVRLFAAELVSQVGELLEQLKSKLFEIASNPTNPEFHHYLFETIAALIDGICSKDASKVVAFESSLFAPFQDILQRDIDEFLPYVFQILAQMLNIGPNLRDNYKRVFKNFLIPVLYDNHGNIPPLVMLLRGYVKQDPAFVLPHLRPILGTFQKLIAMKTHDHEGFYLMEAVIEHIPVEELSGSIKPILQILLARLKSSKTPKYVRCLVVFLSQIIIRHGADFLVENLDGLIANITAQIIDRFWIPVAPTVSGRLERKLCVLGMTKLLCQSPLFLRGYGSLWPKLLLCTLKVLVLPEQTDSNFADEEYQAENVAYSSEFSRLVSIRRLDTDPLPKVNPKQFFATSLGRLTQEFSGRFTRHFADLPPEPRQSLQEICTSFDVQLS